MDRNEEPMGRTLRHLLAGKSNTGAAGCPDDERLAGYLNGAVAGADKAKLEDHLADCAVCLDALSAAYLASEGNEVEDVPRRLLERAMELVPSTAATPGIFDLVVRLAQDSLELVRTSGQMVQYPAPAGIRGQKEASSIPVLQIEKALGKYKVAVEVERVEDELCQIVVTVRDGVESLADGIRLSLLSGGRERASYLAPQGTAVFERIPPGEYQLAVSDAGVTLGSIRLAIMEERDER